MEIITHNDEVIIDKIYTIRNKKVMLDRDIAEIYQVETRSLNQQVKRNEERFPESFSFQLSDEEVNNLRSHFVIANISSKSRVAPRVFTEHGILMLSNVLKTDIAIKMSIQIIEVFIKIRENIQADRDILKKLEQLGDSSKVHEESIKVLFEVTKKLIQRSELQSKVQEIENKSDNKVNND